MECSAKQALVHFHENSPHAPLGRKKIEDEIAVCARAGFQ